MIRDDPTVRAALSIPAALLKAAPPRLRATMDGGVTAAAALRDAAVNLTVAHLRLDSLNASSTATWWEGSPAPGGAAGLLEPQRLIREQAYRDFSTAVQVLILISSLLGK